MILRNAVLSSTRCLRVAGDAENRATANGYDRRKLPHNEAIAGQKQHGLGES